MRSSAGATLWRTCTTKLTEPGDDERCRLIPSRCRLLSPPDCIGAFRSVDYHDRLRGLPFYSYAILLRNAPGRQTSLASLPASSSTAGVHRAESSADCRVVLKEAAASVETPHRHNAAEIGNNICQSVIVKPSACTMWRRSLPSRPACHMLLFQDVSPTAEQEGHICFGGYHAGGSQPWPAVSSSH